MQYRVYILVSFLLTLAITTSMGSTLYIYNDLGVGEDSIKHTETTFKRMWKGDVKKISSEEVIRGDWVNDAKLFIMPGGADLPYCDKLNGAGNKVIKGYVENGGYYLGICAGAYYGSDYVEFDKGGPLEVLGKRELAFYPGKCVGPYLAPYDYQRLSGARAAKISTEAGEFYSFYNGGGAFLDVKKHHNGEVIAEYLANNGERVPAGVKMKCGKGTVILLGMHAEFDPTLMNQEDPYLKVIIPLIKKDQGARELWLKSLLANN